MEKRKLEDVKGKLLQRKRILEEELASLHKERFSDGQVQDAGDQALSSSMEAIKISLQDSELGEYNRIVKALEMIDNGSYGTCIDCDQPISEKRLNLFPNATRCLSCQEILEEGEQEGEPM